MENRKLWTMGTVLVALVLVLGVLLSCAYGLYLTEQTAFRPAPAYYQNTQPTAPPVIQTASAPERSAASTESLYKAARHASRPSDKRPPKGASDAAGRGAISLA